MDDLHDLTRVNVNRILYIVDVAGNWLTLFGSAIVTALAIMAFYYDVEFAQAVFFLFVPMLILGALSARTARRIREKGLREAALIKALTRHRFAVQLIGMVSIFVTAMYGMWTNFYIGPFGAF